MSAPRRSSPRAGTAPAKRVRPAAAGGERVLVVPDVHQNLPFLEAALAIFTAEGCGRVVFLGDYFDARDPSHATTEAAVATAQRVREFAAAHPGRVTLLWGNHDVQALQLGRLAMKLRVVQRNDLLRDLAETAPGIETYLEVAAAWPDDFVRTLRGAALVQGHLLTHAGVVRRYWPGLARDPEGGAASLDQLLIEAVLEFLEGQGEHPWLAAGRARGGTAKAGGPLWLDWNEEFDDVLPLPQVVGHTPGEAFRCKGRSWCIDCGQKAVAILEGGEVTPREIGRAR